MNVDELTYEENLKYVTDSFKDAKLLQKYFLKNSCPADRILNCLANFLGQIQVYLEFDEEDRTQFIKLLMEYTNIHKKILEKNDFLKEE